ncbi:hypothetical protein PF996_21525 (plasmid) [Bacillus velezensis]|uniref:hypothetical protein n=1 Tax=Bacillus velezensis TaxID=492670 RepID=UPI0022F38A48|nr:hypothetical protein [Bacillus velezensis]WBY48007.1 hypothetical protein PF996_21525 [Bacillus velezensis]
MLMQLQGLSGAPSAARAARLGQDTKKAGAWSAPESGCPAASMRRRDFMARRCRCFPNRPVNAGRFLLQMLSFWNRTEPTATDLLQLSGRPGLARTQKKAGAASEPTAADLLQLPGRPVVSLAAKKSRFLSAGSVSTII